LDCTELDHQINHRGTFFLEETETPHLRRHQPTSRWRIKSTSILFRADIWPRARIEFHYGSMQRHSSWSIDESVLPHRTDFSNIRPLTEKEIKASYIVVGGELVSAVLIFDQVTVWQPMVQQIHDDFIFDGHHGGYVSDQQPALHVHFGIQDGDLDLATTQNLIALYGLFEREIERWFPVSRRNSIWCLSVRFGMEANADYQGPDYITRKPLSTTGRRHTPKQFVSSVRVCDTNLGRSQDRGSWVPRSHEERLSESSTGLSSSKHLSPET